MMTNKIYSFLAYVNIDETGEEMLFMTINHPYIERKERKKEEEIYVDECMCIIHFTPIN
jgi:PP-loop superfamily ATP-utilizing enzyme